MAVAGPAISNIGVLRKPAFCRALLLGVPGGEQRQPENLQLTKLLVWGRRLGFLQRACQWTLEVATDWLLVLVKSNAREQRVLQVACLAIFTTRIELATVVYSEAFSPNLDLKYYYSGDSFED